MEALVAIGVGALAAAGIYLLLRLRTFPVIIGTAMLSYGVNLFLFATGRLAVDAPPILTDGITRYTDPLPQALVLTAIVISFGMTAVVVVMALGAFLSTGTDAIDLAAQAGEDAGETDVAQPPDADSVVEPLPDTDDPQEPASAGAGAAR